MRRTDEWAQPEWRHKVTKAVALASFERDSSQELIASAEREFEKLRQLLGPGGAADVLRRAAPVPPLVP
jgi:hypothetical protein